VLYDRGGWKIEKKRKEEGRERERGREREKGWLWSVSGRGYGRGIKPI